MKYSINVPDSVAEAAKARAADLGMSPAEFSRRALVAACTQTDPNEGLERTQAELGRVRAELAEVTAERDRLREDLATAEASAKQVRAEASAAATAREDLAAQVLELEEARHALEKRVIRAEVLAERMEAETTDAREASAKLTAEKDARIGELKQAYDHTVGLLADEKRRAEALIPERSGPSAGTVEAAAPITIQATAATVPPPLRKRMGMAWAIIRGVPA